MICILHVNEECQKICHTKTLHFIMSTHSSRHYDINTLIHEIFSRDPWDKKDKRIKCTKLSVIWILDDDWNYNSQLEAVAMTRVGHKESFSR